MALIPDEHPSYIDEPFSDENDLFNLRGYASQLATFIGSSRTPLTMVLDGTWGTGKTVFARQFCATLDAAGWNVVYFDCYSHDHQRDPLIPLAAAILRRLTSGSERATAEPERNFRRSAVAAARAILPVTAKVGVSLATVGQLSAQDLQETSRRYRDAFDELGDDADVAGAALLEQLDAEMADDTPRAAFRSALQTLISEHDQKPDEFPLVLFLDELDRCRPDFALSLIERIKHFFSIPGICFLFVSNIDELQSVIRHTYGLSTTASTYLEKFFQIRSTIPEAEEFNSTNRHRRLMAYLTRQITIPSQNTSLLETTLENVLDVFSQNTYSLRTLQRVVTHVGIYFRAAGSILAPPPIIAGLAILKQIEPAMYQKAAKGVLKWREVDNFFEFSEWNMSEDEIDYFKQFWEHATDARAHMDTEKAGAVGHMMRQGRLHSRGNILRDTAGTMDSFASFDAG